MDPNQAGEIRERLSRLWMQAEPAVNAYVFAAVHRFQDAEDVVQQVVLAAARRFEEYDASRSFVGWVLWLAKSKIVDHYRAQGRRKVVFSETLLDQMAARLVERQAADHAGAAASRSASTSCRPSRAGSSTFATSTTPRWRGSRRRSIPPPAACG